MEALYSLPFNILEIPNLKVKKPSWIHQPSAMVMFSLVLMSYFLVTGGKTSNFYSLSIIILIFYSRYYL